MKKIILLIAFSVFVVGCKPKQQVTSTKVDNKSERVIKGDWTITSVTYPGSEVIKVKSFELADSKCFVGSTWRFVSNNNTGSMALSAAGCDSYSTDITWYINKEGRFVMKFLDEGLKAKKVTQGYILTVANQTETTFQLLDGINVGGKMVNVVYQFEKK